MESSSCDEPVKTCTLTQCRHGDGTPYLFLQCCRIWSKFEMRVHDICPFLSLKVSPATRDMLLYTGVTLRPSCYQADTNTSFPPNALHFAKNIIDNLEVIQLSFPLQVQFLDFHRYLFGTAQQYTLYQRQVFVMRAPGILELGNFCPKEAVLCLPGTCTTSELYFRLR